MDNVSKARTAIISVLTLAAGGSVGLMFSIGGGLQPIWLWSTVGGWIILSAGSWAATGRFDREAKGDRFRMPVRPGTETAIEPMERPKVARGFRFEVPTRDGIVRPTTLASAGLPTLETQVEHATGMTAEPGETDEMEDEVPTAVDVPTGFTMRGFTLFERMQKGKPIRFFSKGKPVGGGVPIQLPEGHEAKWDGKKKRPTLVAPDPVAARSEVVEAPVAPRMDLTRAETAPPLIVTQTIKPCSAMPSPGVFCENPARKGEIYCAKHVDFDPERASRPKLDVVKDGAEARGKAPKFALPEFVVRRDGPSLVPTTATKGKKGKAPKPSKGKPTLEVEFARGDGKPLKPLKFEPKFVVERDHGAPAAAKGKTARKASAPVLTVRQDRGAPQPTKGKTAKKGTPSLEVQQDRAEHKAGRAVRPRVVELEINKAEAHELPRTRAVDTKLIIKAAEAHEMPSGFKAKFVADDANILTGKWAPESARKGRKSRCKADLTTGGRCSNDARDNSVYCSTHRNHRPVTELVVQKDTKARTMLGVPGAGAKGKRGR